MILGSIARVWEIVGAFFGREGLGNFADGDANGFDGSRGRFSQEMLAWRRSVDGVQVGWLFWQEEELGSHRANELTHGFAFVAGERPIAIALPSGARWCGFCLSGVCVLCG